MEGSLALAVKELAAADLASWSDEELRHEVTEVARLRAALEAAEARVVAEFDRRRCWAADGAQNAVAWLAYRTREPRGECRRRVALGRSFRDLPVAAEAALAGDIAPAHVRRLAAALNKRTAADLARDEAKLVHDAQQLSFSRFDRTVSYWTLHADPDGADQDEIDRRDQRQVRLARTFGGWALAGFLDPVKGEIVHRQLTEICERLFKADWAEAKARLGRDPLAHELARTPGQRRADALVEMARRSATAPANGKAPKPLFTLVLGSDELRHLCQLEGGQVVSPEAVRPWLTDADLERILFDGAGSRVIDVSYKRGFRGALRRLIEVRDQSCFHQSCEETPEHAQVDHIEPWAWGGITEQENGRLACGFHNRGRHKRRPPPSDA